MALPATDDFTAVSDQDLEDRTNWDEAPRYAGDNLLVVSADGELEPNGGNIQQGQWTGDSFDNDQYAEVNVTGIQNNVSIGPALRCSGIANTGYGYHFTTENNSWELYKMVNGSYTTIASDSHSWTAPFDLSLEISGTTLTAKKDGGQVTQQTDSSISSGAAGVGGYGKGNSEITSWEGGNLAVGQTFEDSLVLAADGAIVTPVGTMVFNPTLLLDVDASDQEQGPLEAGGNAQLNAEAVIAQLGNLVIDAQLQMNTQATQAQAGGLTIENAITLVTQASQSEQAFLTLTTLVNLLAEAQHFQLANQIHQAALTMTADSEQIEAATAVMEETLLMATQAEQLQTGSLTLEGLLNFAAQATLSTLGQKVLNLLISLEAQATQSTAAILVMNQLVSLLTEATTQELGNLQAEVQLTFSGQATQAEVGELTISALVTMVAEALQSQSGEITAQIFNEFLTFAAQATQLQTSQHVLLGLLNMAVEVQQTEVALANFIDSITLAVTTTEDWVDSLAVILGELTLSAEASQAQASELQALGVVSFDAETILTPVATAQMLASLTMATQVELSPAVQLVIQLSVLLAAEADYTTINEKILIELLTLAGQAAVTPEATIEMAAALSLEIQADIQGLANKVINESILMGVEAQQAHSAGEVFLETLTLSVASVLIQAEAEYGNLLPDVLIATAESLLTPRTAESSFGPYQAEKQ